MTGSPGDEAGRCALCGGTLQMRSATIPFVRGDRVVTIREVPAEVCEECGEAYMSGATTDRVQELVDGLEAAGAEMTVARYQAA